MDYAKSCHVAVICLHSGLQLGNQSCMIVIFVVGHIYSPRPFGFAIVQSLKIVMDFKHPI